MNLRPKLGMFVLTREEQRTIAFVVLAVVLGLWTKHYRSTHARATAAPKEINQRATPPGSAPPATTAPHGSKPGIRP